MKNIYVLLFSVILLSGCKTTSNIVDRTSEYSDATDMTRVNPPLETSTSFDMMENNTTSQQDESAFPYAVNLNDFIREVAVSDDQKETIYRLNFITNQEKLPRTIVLNTKDLNDFGKAIYLSLADEYAFYPISIKLIPTRKITILGNDGYQRNVSVNTEVRIETYEGNHDPLQLIGDTYYLFYNDQGSISFATRNFHENIGPETLDTMNMIEYIQTNSDSTDKNTNESIENEDFQAKYYDLIYSAWKRQKDYIDSFDDQKTK